MFDEANLPKGYPAPGPVGQILVKQYPAARIAVNHGGDQDSMFMPLFNHIKKHDIAMSSPVEITWSDPQTQPADAKPQAMAFVYREPDIGAPGIDGKVEVIDVPPQTFLSVGMRGSYNRQHLVEGVQKLRGWLTAHSNEYKETGPPRYLGYNKRARIRDDPKGVKHHGKSGVWRDCHDSARITDVIVAPVGGIETGIPHPAMFPIELASQLVQTFSPVGGKVADCFCGSGTTCLAARNHGRNWWGADIVPKYVQLAHFEFLVAHCGIVRHDFYC
jgi:hypothetical protein